MQVPTLAATILAAGALGTATVATQNRPATAQSAPVVAPADALMTMPLLEDRGWFIHARAGRVRACFVDGVSVGEAKTPPRCSDCSE